MGWWSTNPQGQSFAGHDPEMLWGDSPADHMDDAIKKIIKEFVSSVNRPPTRKEMIAGLHFSFGGFDEFDENEE